MLLDLGCYYFSEFLIKRKKPISEPKKVDIGKVNNIKLGKLKAVSCKIIFIGTSFPAAFLNCSTKSPMNMTIDNTKNVIKNE